MLVRPDLFVEDITTLDLAALKSRGIKGFIFDLDNTIMAPHTGLLEDRIAAWLDTLRAEGFKLIVLSNNKRPEYVHNAQSVLQIPCIGNARKPRRGTFYQALEMMGLEAHEVAMVGDRPLTDIWVGNRIGSYTILVDPLIKHQETPLIKFLRGLERLFVQGGKHTAS